MTEELKNPTLPKSVIAYLSDPATRAGVDALLAVESDSLPPEIEWAELGDYFAARAVAELTRAEFAVALHLLWQAIWGPIIRKKWTLPAPEDLDEAGQGVSTGDIWDEKAFFVYHECDHLALYTLVGLNRRRLVVAFSLERRDRPQIKGGVEGFTWRDDGHWPAWMLLTEGVAPDEDGRLDLPSLRAAAERAIAAVEATPEPRNRKPADRAVRAKPKSSSRRRNTKGS